MSHVDRTIERIPGMKATERSSWRQKALRELERRPKSTDALRLLCALDEFDARPTASMSREITGLLAWEKYERGNETPFRAFHGDRVVGRIIKRATHTASRKEVYSVEVLGQVVAGRWQNISDARMAGEAAYAQLQSDRPT